MGGDGVVLDLNNELYDCLLHNNVTHDRAKYKDALLQHSYQTI